MEDEKMNLLKDFLAHNMLQLSLKFHTINKASTKFELPKELVRTNYYKVRVDIRKRAFFRALIYFLIGGMALFIGVKGSFGESSKVFLYGAILVGTGGILTSIGLFMLGIKGFITPE